MKKIIDGKLFNTETAEIICSFWRKCNGPELTWLPGYCFVKKHDINLCRTKNGTYFEHDTEEDTITPVTEDEAKNIIQELDPDKFMELFGCVPEA